MAKLVAVEQIGGGRFERWWTHEGDDGRKKLTVETVQDAEPAIDNAKALAENTDRKSLLRFKANVTATQLEEACRIAAKLWGQPFPETFREVMQAKTDRAKSVWRNLTEGRDFRKLQAKHWK